MTPPPGRPSLSLVVPCYQEAARLPSTLHAIRQWLPPQPVEVLLVDDGSPDATRSLALRTSLPHPHTLRVIPLPHRGKATAVTTGCLLAQAPRILFSDADLSVPLHHVDALHHALDHGADLAIASRQAPGASRHNEPLHRHLLGRGFNLLTRALLAPGIADTQCGFKLFTRHAALAIFSRLTRHTPLAPPLHGPSVTAFDAEALFVARRLHLHIAEVPVPWTHHPSPNVRPLLDAPRMLRDLIRARWDHRHIQP